MRVLAEVNPSWIEIRHERWIDAVLREVGIHGKTDRMLKELARHENWMKMWDLGYRRRCSEAERRELDAWHQEVLRNYSPIAIRISRGRAGEADAQVA